MSNGNGAAFGPPRPPSRRPRQKSATGRPLWKDEEVLAWGRKRMKAGRTREQLVAESKAGSHGWPLPGQYLAQNAADRVRAVVEDRDNNPGRPRRRPPKYAGKRRRQLHAETRTNGGPTPLSHATMDIVQLIGILEGVDLPEYGLGDVDGDTVADLHEDLLRLRGWLDASEPVVVAYMDEAARWKRIRTLRERTVEAGFTPAEAAAAALKADELEGRLRNEIGA